MIVGMTHNQPETACTDMHAEADDNTMSCIQPVVEDTEQRERIRAAFAANTHTSRYADDLTIDAQDGVVLLRGTVDSLHDSDQLLEVAMQVEGVHEVIDRMQVRSLV